MTVETIIGLIKAGYTISFEPGSSGKHIKIRLCKGDRTALTSITYDILKDGVAGPDFIIARSLQDDAEKIEQIFIILRQNDEKENK